MQDEHGPRALANDEVAFPMVDSYRVTYAYFLAQGNPEYKGPFNQIRDFARLITPDDKAVQTPNSDTAYSFLGVDLRAEPVVITVPKIEKNRYYVLQFVDTYTHNFAYVGSTTTGNDGGSFLVAGPRWNGKTRKRVKKVIHSEAELALVPSRTQPFGPDDIENVKQVQAGFKAQRSRLSSASPGPRPLRQLTSSSRSPLTSKEIRSNSSISSTSSCNSARHIRPRKHSRPGSLGLTLVRGRPSMRASSHPK
jgi:hypothetical protein